MKIQYVILLFLSVITSTDVTPDYNEYAFSISWMSKFLLISHRWLMCGYERNKANNVLSET